jgi:hypothetical protein
MSQNDRLSKIYLRESLAQLNMVGRHPKPERNHPVPVEAFERQCLGIAAKE